MASISGSVSASFIPEHKEDVESVFQAVKAKVEEVARERGFDGSVSVSVGDGSGWLSVSLSKIHAPTTGPGE